MDSIWFYNLVPYKTHACPATRNAELAGWLERALEAYAEEWLECSTARRETMTIGLSFLIICFAISMGIVCIVISIKALKKDRFIHIRRPIRLAETRRLGLVSAGFGIGCFMLLLLPNLVTLPAYFWRQSIGRSMDQAIWGGTSCRALFLFQLLHPVSGWSWCHEKHIWTYRRRLDCSSRLCRF